MACNAAYMRSCCINMNKITRFRRSYHGVLDSGWTNAGCYLREFTYKSRLDTLSYGLSVYQSRAEARKYSNVCEVLSHARKTCHMKPVRFPEDHQTGRIT